MDEQQERQYQIQRLTVLTDTIGKTVTTFIWALSAVAIVYFIVQGIGHLAGQETKADISLILSGIFNINKATGYGVCVIAIAYGLFQRRLRQKNIQRESARVKHFEEKLDPERTSSNLTPKGRTPKGG